MIGIEDRSVRLEVVTRTDKRRDGLYLCKMLRVMDGDDRRMIGEHGKDTMLAKGGSHIPTTDWTRLYISSSVFGN